MPLAQFRVALAADERVPAQVLWPDRLTFGVSLLVLHHTRTKEVSEWHRVLRDVPLEELAVNEVDRIVAGLPVVSLVNVGAWGLSQTTVPGGITPPFGTTMIPPRMYQPSPSA